MKQCIGVLGNDQGHWVGDGFPVRTLFFYQEHGQQMSPFLMLDFAGPAEFSPSEKSRGVGSHPHRGFETVTIVYEGEVAHADSAGNGGTIGPGDVQWMTAGAGILHEEFHSRQFTQEGGVLNMVQLWVNLPAKHKMTQPNYQAILKDGIPRIAIHKSTPNQEQQTIGAVRIIAGSYEGIKGPANTFTPMNVLDLSLQKGETWTMPAPEGWNTSIVVLNGKLTAGELEAGNVAQDAQMLVFSKSGQEATITALEDTSALILSGEPIDEPIVGYGPFVMNTKEEIAKAISDFNSGNFGKIH